MHRHHADLIRRIADHHRVEAGALSDHALHLGEQVAVVHLQHQAVDMLARDDHELGEVDGIGALAQDRALRPLLSTISQEGAHVEKIGGAQVARQRLRRAERRAVPREDVADLPLRDGHQRLAVDAILEGHEEMVAAAQHGRLIASLAPERDQALGDGTVAAPQLLNDGNAVVANVAHAARENEKQDDDESNDS